MTNADIETGSGVMDGEQAWRAELPGGRILKGFRRPPAPGSPLPEGLFVHGFRSHCDGAKSRRLSAAAGALGAGWLRFDQYGCGMSPGEFRRFTLSGAIDDTRTVLDHPDHGRHGVLAGSSLGALIALHVARSRPGRVAGLLLIAPALRFSRHFIHAHLDQRQLDSWRTRGYRWFPDLYEGGCYRLDHDFCRDALGYGEPPAALHCPVRVLHGSRDELLPVSDTEKWLQRLDCPAADLEIVDGGDHRLSRWTDVIARHAENLLKEVPRSCA